MENEKYGLEKYTPSRLEWLVVMVNTRFQIGNLAVNGFKLSFSPGFDERTINVDITYAGEIDVKTLEELKEIGREAVELIGGEYGWLDWVEVNINETLLPEN